MHALLIHEKRTANNTNAHTLICIYIFDSLSVPVNDHGDPERRTPFHSLSPFWSFNVREVKTKKEV